MNSLQIAAGDRSWTFDGTRPVTIGRDPQSDVQLEGGTVSRRHAEIRPDATGWTLVDIGSSSGTFSGSTRVTELRLSGQGSFRVGGSGGEELRFTVAGARPAASSQDVALPEPGLAQTMLPGGSVPGSYAPGPALLVRTGGSSRRFVPGTMVRIGRDPANEVVVDDSSVSRLHAVVESRPDGWWFVDRSTAGTFAEEDRVSARKLTEPTTLMLGHPTAGVEVEVVPVVDARQAQRTIAGKKRKRTALLVGGIAAAVLLVGGGVTAAVVLGGDDDEDGGSGGTTSVEGLTDAELDRAKAATVFLVSVVGGEPVSTGSGSVISEDGLILTNAHVADKSAPGFEPADVAPDYLLVGIPPADDVDAPVELLYRANAIATDGPLDLSVIQINADVDGNEVAGGDLDLPEPMPIGDSEEVRTGDELVALGFPGLAAVDLEDPFARPVTVTEGVASTIKAVPPFGEDAWIESDLRLGSGNSGGPTINDDGELIGINTEVRTRETQGDDGQVFTSGSALMRPAKWATDVIDAAASGQPYTSPWVGEVEPTEPEMTAEATVAPGGWSLDGAGGCANASTPDAPQILAGATFPGTVYAEFSAVGVPDGTPFELQFYSLDGATQLGATPSEWDQGTGEVCVSFFVDIPESIPGLIAVLVIGDIQVENPVAFQ